MDSGFYAACAGLRARTQALEVVANNLANINTTGYASSQVDHRKVGKLAIAIQVAFQELGVFPASSTAISLNSAEPVPFNTVQAIENAERTAALGRIVPTSKGILGASESGDLSSLRQELEDALAPEIQKNEVAVSVGPEGLVISLREIGFFDSGSAQIRPVPFRRSAESPGCSQTASIECASKGTPITVLSIMRSLATTGSCRLRARRDWFAC